MLSCACHAGMASGWAQGKTGPYRTLSSLRATGPEAVFEAGGHGKVVARAMYHPELLRHPDSCPALVLNADYTPLSYYPLSLWPWQTAVKSMFLERVDVVAHYEREVHSPSRSLKLPSVIALQAVRPAQRISGVHAVQPVPARPLPLRLLRVGARTDLRPCGPARLRRPDDVGECRHRLRAVQPQEGRANAARGQDAHRARADPPDQLAAAGSWQELPAQLSSRKLARLPLLGHRAGAVGPSWRRVYRAINHFRSSQTA